ncbi:universal stress protein [Fimbriiglobus ruber]|uniref:Universal stress protein family, tandem domain n=1 Tax=Fimbriiglobus ruber TaxID=1908690 RepID=A0A225E3C5_9BACT|nr:universal stress protein [Fimbriiglobus ruber]OWK43185.1 Universal stress protein family, tandem domain [Fimbriiglobus ruber]
MLKSMLVGLDGTAYAAAATELGIRWAEQYDALLVGIGVVDVPMVTTPEATPMGATFVTGTLDYERLVASRHKVERWLEAFSLRCAAARVSSKVLQYEEDALVNISTQAERYDLVILGQQTHFRYETHAGPCDTLDQLLHRPPRPVVAVPDRIPGGRTVVIAYDGSPQAARTVAAFRATGIAAKYPTVVLTIGDDHVEAARVAGRAVEYLGFHGLHAKTKIVSAKGNVGERLLEEVSKLDAQLLVMGAFSHSAVRDFFFGSTTRRVLKATGVPVFLYH